MSIETICFMTFLSTFMVSHVVNIALNSLKVFYSLSTVRLICVLNHSFVPVVINIDVLSWADFWRPSDRSGEVV